MKFAISYTAAILLLAITKTEAAALFDSTVTCDPSSPSDVCRGALEFYSPSPVMVDKGDGTYETTYSGGWHWFYTFVRGLPDGYVDHSGIGYEEYEYGPQIYISLDDAQATCSVTVGEEVCNRCELCSLGGWVDGTQSATFTADCTNIEGTNDVGAGMIVECGSTLPFFYPLELPDPVSDGPTASPTIGGLRH